MIFKYQTEFNHLSVKCPPKDCAQLNASAFRWVFDQIDDNRNFQPLFFRNPQRVNDFGDIEKCQALGLSMYDSEANATRQFNFLRARIGDMVFKMLGTRIAAGQLTAEDGIGNNPDRKGHFTFHPSKTCTFEGRFHLVATL